MKNVKFRGFPRKKQLPRLNSAEKPKFRGSARNPAGHGKLWALVISTVPHKMKNFKILSNRSTSPFFHFLFSSELSFSPSNLSQSTSLQTHRCINAGF